MMKKIISCLCLILFIVSLAFSLTGCENNKDNKYITRSKTISDYYFNTGSLLSSYGDASEAEFNRYVALCEEKLSYYHKLFDIYYEYAGVNNIRTINKNAGISPVEVDVALIDFLEYCKEIFTLTNGKTNVMLGSVLKLWHNFRENATENEKKEILPTASDLPSEEELSRASVHTSIDALVIDREAGTVYISDPLASLDVGAVAKGYTVELLYDELLSLGAKSVVINVGRNIRTIGLKPNGDMWVSGIYNPDITSDSPIKCKVAFGEGSIVTSGDYERFVTIDGEKYHHIIDPDTLQPASYFSSVTVLTQDSGLADALSTALFCMSYEDGLSFISELDDVEAVWIYKDGRLAFTDGVLVE